MEIVFRVDSSTRIGAGHIMRCVTLADALRLRDKDVTFVCQKRSDDLRDYIESRGYRTVGLSRSASDSADFGNDERAPVSWEEDAAATLRILESGSVRPAWLIVDHYGLDSKWESTLRHSVSQVMAIDDLANRSHDCDMLLDQNLGSKPESYRDLVPAQCEFLIGPTFALLRRQFLELREEALIRRSQRGTIERLFVLMGGTDPANTTGTILECLLRCRWPKPVDVVMGSKAPHLAAVRNLCNKLSSARLHVDTSAVAKLMLAADLAFGAAGTSSWERCSMALPTLVTINASNQRMIAWELESIGAARVVGESSSITPEDYTRALETSLSAPDEVAAMAQAAASVCDGGGTERVVNQMYPSRQV